MFKQQRKSQDINFRAQYQSIVDKILEKKPNKLTLEEIQTRISELNALRTLDQDVQRSDRALQEVVTLIATTFQHTKELVLNLENNSHIKLIQFLNKGNVFLFSTISKLTLLNGSKTITPIQKDLELFLQTLGQTNAISTVQVVNTAPEIFDIIEKSFKQVTTLKIHNGPGIGKVSQVLKLSNAALSSLDLSCTKLSIEELSDLTHVISRSASIKNIVLTNCFNEIDLTSTQWLHEWSEFLSTVVKKNITSAVSFDGPDAGMIDCYNEAALASWIVQNAKSSNGILVLSTSNSQNSDLIRNLASSRSEVLKAMFDSAGIDTVQFGKINMPLVQMGPIVEKIASLGNIKNVVAQHLDTPSFHLVMKLVNAGGDLESIDLSNTNISTPADLKTLSENLHCAKKLSLEHCLSSKVASADQAIWGNFIKALSQHNTLTSCTLDYDKKVLSSTEYAQARAAASIAIKKMGSTILRLDLSKDENFFKQITPCAKSILHQIISDAKIDAIEVSNVFQRTIEGKVKVAIVSLLQDIGSIECITQVKISEASVEALDALPYFTNLKKLSIHTTKEKSLEKLFNVLYACSNTLTELDLSGTPLPKASLQDFHKILHPTLHTLVLDGCFAEAHSQIVRSHVLLPLLSNTGLRAVSFNGNATSLEDHMIRLSDIETSQKWIQNSLTALTKLLQASGIKHLYINEHRLEDADNILQAFADTQRIETLTMDGLRAHSSGRILSIMSKVKKLNLPSFSEEDLSATNIPLVSFRGTKFSSDNLERLSQMLPKTKFTNLDMIECLKGNLDPAVWMKFIYSIMDTTSVQTLDIDRGDANVSDTSIKLLHNLIDCRKNPVWFNVAIRQQHQALEVAEINKKLQEIDYYSKCNPGKSDELQLSFILYSLRMIFKNYDKVVQHEIPMNELSTKVYPVLDQFNRVNKLLNGSLQEEYISVLRGMLTLYNIDAINLLIDIPKWYDIVHPNIKHLGVQFFDEKHMEIILAPTIEEAVATLKDEIQIQIRQRQPDQLIFLKSEDHSFVYDALLSMAAEAAGGNHARLFDISHLSSLDIQGNIGSAVLLHLLQRLPGTKITKFGIGCNIVDTSRDDALQALAEILPKSHITKLSLRGMIKCNFKVLFQKMLDSNLTSLEIINSHLSSIDLHELSVKLPHSKLSTLSLKGSISDRGALCSVEDYCQMLREMYPQHEDVLEIFDANGFPILEDEVQFHDEESCFVRMVHHQPTQDKFSIDRLERNLLSQRSALYPEDCILQFVNTLCSGTHNIKIVDLSGNAPFITVAMLQDVERSICARGVLDEIKGSRHLYKILQELCKWYQSGIIYKQKVDFYNQLKYQLSDSIELLLSNMSLGNSSDDNIDQLLLRSLQHMQQRYEGAWYYRHEWKDFDCYDDRHDRLLPWNVDEDVVGQVLPWNISLDACI